MDVKACAKCGREKDLSDFHRDAKMKQGVGSWCKVCVVEAQRERRATMREADKEATLSKQRAYYRKNEERIRAKRNEYRSANRELENARKRERRDPASDRRRRYGTDGKELLRAQQGLCAVCFSPITTGLCLLGDVGEPTKDAALDHCHESGVVRGWLCRSCNQALGFLRDDAEALRRAADYVERFGIFK